MALNRKQKKATTKKTKRKKLHWALRTLRMLIVIGLIGALYAIMINTHVVNSTREHLLSPEDAAVLGADCIIVLGAGAADGDVHPLLWDRLARGVELCEMGAASTIIMSGDQNQAHEVSTMKNYAVDAGIPPSNVLMDIAGFSTYESVFRTNEIFEGQTVIIVSQEYHLYRAVYIARSFGLEAYGVAAAPNNVAGQTYRDVREILARNKDFLFSLFKPKPTYTGETIPITEVAMQLYDRTPSRFEGVLSYRFWLCIMAAGDKIAN